MQGGNQEPKILEEQIPCKLDKMPNGHLDSLDNAEICDINTPTASTVTSRYYKGIGSHKDNMCIVAMRGRNPDNPSDRTAGNPTEQRLEVNMQDTSNCLTSVQKDNLVLENPLLLGGVGKENEFGSQYRQGNRVYSSDACAMALNSQPVGNAGGNSYLYNVGYRIRKLTPRECGRLMGVSDEDIDKMAAVNSNTQLYKQFGNSIVVDVMCAMFKNLNIKQGDTV
jgi:site-specific DNA-cytosine methylase